jgi:hypothetical protein
VAGFEDRQICCGTLRNRLDIFEFLNLDSLRIGFLEVAMGVLMLTCPSTAREFSTGIFIEEDSLKKLPNTAAKARCPHCGLTHTWWPQDAWLADHIPLEQRTERLDQAF